MTSGDWLSDIPLKKGMNIKKSVFFELLKVDGLLLSLTFPVIVSAIFFETAKSPSWWFQPSCKILVKLDHFHRDRGENKKCVSCHHLVSLCQKPSRHFGRIFPTFRSWELPISTWPRHAFTTFTIAVTTGKRPWNNPLDSTTFANFP